MRWHPNSIRGYHSTPTSGTTTGRIRHWGHLRDLSYQNQPIKYSVIPFCSSTYPNLLLPMHRSLCYQNMKQFQQPSTTPTYPSKEFPYYNYSHVRCSCPKELFDLIANTYGTENTFNMLLNSNEKAPLTIRVNPLKTTREEVQINLITY